MAANGEPIPSRQQAQRDEETDDNAATEQTPLLSQNDGPNQTGEQDEPRGRNSATSLLRSLQRSPKGARRRWPSLLALFILCLFAVLIMVFAFFAPSIMEQYASQAVVFEPKRLSIDSFTSSGVRARVQGDFMTDASRVKSKPVRDIGKAATWIARAVESGETEMEISLPEYGNVVLGTAQIPRIKVNIRNGHRTPIDFLSELQPGDADGIRRLANDFIDDRLGQLRILAKAAIPIKSGIFSFGTQKVQQEMLFANHGAPAIPEYKIQKLNVHEREDPKQKGMAADVSLLVKNEYPVDFMVPPLSFDILVDNCAQRDDPYIMVAQAVTNELLVRPNADVELNATSVVHPLPSALTQDCPDSKNSPMDILLGKYIHGEPNTVYVRGSDSPSPETPRWITDLISDITVPLPVPGRTMGHLIKNFSLTNTHFSLPDPFADPKAPESNPRISAKIRVLVALPKEMNFNVNVSRVRADTDVFYKNEKLGHLDLSKWQDANSTRVESEDNDEGPTLMVESMVEDAPLIITNQNVFTNVIKDLMFGGNSIIMKIQAEVDVQVQSAVGNVTIRNVPANGQVPIKPIARPPHSPGDGPGNLDPSLFKPKITDLQIVNTSSTGLTVRALINITNPTNYTATVPYVDIHVIKNGSLLGHVTAQNLEIKSGNNSHLAVITTYNPFLLGGANATIIGRDLLSQYISGFNTTVILSTHTNSFPSNPILGEALSQFPVNITIPRLSSTKPDDGDDDDDDGDGKEGDDKPHFIRSATMHLFTSTATFLLLSPLHHSTLYITSINATAFYQSDPVGRILYETPFAVPPVEDTPDQEGFLTPSLPVEWSLGSIGYGAVRRALGGTLKLSAKADVGVRLGLFSEKLWFQGGAIGTKVKI